MVGSKEYQTSHFWNQPYRLVVTEVIFHSPHPILRAFRTPLTRHELNTPLHGRVLQSYTNQTSNISNISHVETNPLFHPCPNGCICLGSRFNDACNSRHDWRALADRRGSPGINLSSQKVVDKSIVLYRELLLTALTQPSEFRFTSLLSEHLPLPFGWSTDTPHL